MKTILIINKKFRFLYFSCTLSLIVFTAINVNSQETFPVSGGEVFGSLGVASFTIGQLFFNTNDSPNGSYSEGIQQPYEISTISNIGNDLPLSLLLNIYPNPTSDILTLKIENNYSTVLSYQLFNIKGQLVETKIVQSSETSIDMSNLPPSIYFLRVLKRNNETKTFRIVKK